MASVSVLISAYNEERYICASIQSILDQSFDDIEVLVADDGSSDSTFDKISSFKDNRITAFKNKNQGKAATLNFLLEQATGKYVVIQDGDDISCATRIQKLWDHMEQHPSLAIVLSGHSLIVDDKVVAAKAKPVSPQKCQQEIEALRLPGHDPTAFVRSDIANQFRFNSDLRMGQGLDFIFRIAEQHPIEVYGEALYQYRVHFKSITRSDPMRKARLMFEVLNLAKQRRGQSVMEFDEFLEQNARWVKDPDNNLSGHFTESAYLCVQQNKRLEAIKTALVSLRFLPRGRRYLKPLLYALSPKFVVAFGKRKFGMAS